MEVLEGIGSGRHKDYVRCHRCGFLDRSDFMARRFKETWAACRKCGGTHIVEPRMVSEEDWKRIGDGYYDFYRQRDDPALVGSNGS